MAFHPVIHEPIPSVRFGRSLPIEISPGPPEGARCRYCRVFDDEPLPPRAHFSEPSAAVRSILGPLERGASVDAVVFTGPGDPFRHRAIGTILRNLRTRAHVTTVVLTDGVLLRDRDVRRDAGEAGLVVAWLPSPTPTAGDREEQRRRADAFERHVEGIASLRRETPARIALEIPVRPGVDDLPGASDAWIRAAKRIRPDRMLVVPAPGVGDEAATSLEAVLATLPSAAGAYLSDDTGLDDRCYCD